MRHHKIVFVLWSLHLIEHRCVIGQKYFTAGFQSSSSAFSKPDDNVWLEFRGNIHPSKELTVCHWTKIKFFNNGIDACLWSYCTIENQSNPMECLQLCYWGIEDNANRNLEVKISIPSRKGGLKHWAIAPLKRYVHRTWHHLCWILSIITGSSKFYHNGDEIVSQKGSIADIDLAIKGSPKMYQSSLLFGQEPDSIRDGFDSYQAFIGDLSEFNVWNYTLSGSKIASLAACKSFEKGNIVSWELNNFINTNVEITKFSDSTTLCNRAPRFVIFPERLQYPEAKEICKVHGGSLAVPHSEEENNILIDIVYKHKPFCIENTGPAAGKLVWIGAEQVDGNWHEVSRDSHHWSNNSGPSPSNYTKFLPSDSHDSNQKHSNSDCAYLRRDGYWEDGMDNYCGFLLSLCTICIFYGHPVLTVKGNCRESLVDWNYYPIIDSKYQIKLYEGYRMKSKICFDEDSRNWKLSMTPAYSQKNIEFELSADIFAGKHPIGRKKWLATDPYCGMDSSDHPLSISVCDFPLEFTCDSGICVDIKKRCNGKKECPDGSDEQLCSLIHIPDPYDNASAPEPKIEDGNLEIHIDTRIIKINSIDTINMMVTLTMELCLKWNDVRLSFVNPSFDQDNVISESQSQKLWTPMGNMIHENAIVGDVNYDGNEMKILRSNPEPSKTTEVMENAVYNGSSNPIELTQRMKIKYDCRFDVKKFPFDDQNCSFIMKIKQQKMISVRFVSTRNAVYDGPPIVDQFSIGKIYINTKYSEKSARFTIHIHMIRNFTNQLLNTFIPTLILWLFGYSTLFIDMSDFGDRFMGAGTSLLVIATLFSAISNDLPKTSYMKFIDIWFLWHNISILAIISFHILMNRFGTYLEKLANNEVTPSKAMVWITSTRLYRMKAINQVNNIVTMAFPILHVLFYAMYFHSNLY